MKYELREGNILMYSPYLWRVVKTEGLEQTVAMMLEREPAEFLVRELNRREPRTTLDDRSPLMKRLWEVMPKELKEPPKPHSYAELQFKVHPIRISAEVFTGFLGGELPANQEEMRAVLWTFGEILSGDMEKRLHEIMKIARELDNLRPAVPIVVKSKESKDDNTVDDCDNSASHGSHVVEQDGTTESL